MILMVSKKKHILSGNKFVFWVLADPPPPPTHTHTQTHTFVYEFPAKHVLIVFDQNVACAFFHVCLRTMGGQMVEEKNIERGLPPEQTGEKTPSNLFFLFLCSKLSNGKFSATSKCKSCPKSLTKMVDKPPFSHSQGDQIKYPSYNGLK